MTEVEPNLWTETPLIRSSHISNLLGCSAYLKLEVRTRHSDPFMPHLLTHPTELAALPILQIPWPLPLRTTLQSPARRLRAPHHRLGRKRGARRGLRGARARGTMHGVYHRRRELRDARFSAEGRCGGGQRGDVLPGRAGACGRGRQG